MQARSTENVSVQWLAGELYVKLLKMWFQIYYCSSVLNKLRYIRKKSKIKLRGKKTILSEVFKAKISAALALNCFFIYTIFVHPHCICSCV